MLFLVDVSFMDVNPLLVFIKQYNEIRTFVTNTKECDCQEDCDCELLYGEYCDKKPLFVKALHDLLKMNILTIVDAWKSFKDFVDHFTSELERNMGTSIVHDIFLGTQDIPFNYLKYDYNFNTINPKKPIPNQRCEQMIIREDTQPMNIRMNWLI